MGIIRPATPGFLVTLTAAALLAVVVFSVPYFKSVFFLKASLENQGITGSITFGVLGYCLELNNGTTCSKPSIGYSLDINKLVGDNTRIQIPDVIVKWITYALVLHIVALVLAAVSAVFGLLAHVREFSMTCCSTCFSGGAAAVALIAFIFDLAFFFISKSRINKVQGGSASFGIGIWLTLAAWLLLFFAGCFFGLGRCCVSRRSRDSRREPPQPEDGYSDQMRMQAIQAEADRKARQQKTETGLPAFPETQPLTSKMDSEEWMEDGDHIVPYQPAHVGGPGGAAGIGAGTAAYSRQGSSPPTQYSAGGYAQAPAGTRAVDDYYNARPTQRVPGAYPPQPRRQGSSSTQYTQYTQSTNSNTPAPPVPSGPTPTQYLGAGAGAYGGHLQNASAASQQAYGHPERGTTYHSATSHQQYPTNYSQHQEPAQTGFNSDVYNASGYMPDVNSSAYATQPAATYSNAQPYGGSTALYAAASTPYTGYGHTSPPRQHTPERSYTLGGDGYPQQQQQHYPDDSGLQPSTYNQAHNSAVSSYMTSPYSPMPSPHESSNSPTPQGVQGMPAASSPHAQTPGPSLPVPQHAQAYDEPVYEDSPPVYDDATAQPAGQWNSKR